MTTTPKSVIFTDLDGTLLDQHSYSFEAALPALLLIRERDIPLILSSSKTRREIEFYRKRLESEHPFISENGGGVFIPGGYFSFSFPCDREIGYYSVLELGTSYSQLVGILGSIQEETRISIKGFSDLTEEEISSLCGLSLKEAKFAKVRDYDEPFLIEGGEREVEIVKKKIREKGMNYVWGGRFHHILGNNDKGRAVEILKLLFEKEFLSIFTIGIGDSMNDLPMLLAVDHPIFLKKRDERLPVALSPIQNLTVVEGTGPEAWNGAILPLLAGRKGAPERG